MASNFTASMERFSITMSSVGTFTPAIPQTTRVLLMVIYALIFLVGFSGNSVVCYVIGKSLMLFDIYS